jgi:hypothetical protein
MRKCNALSITVLSITTLSIMILNITIISTMKPSITRQNNGVNCDTQHNDANYNDTQLKLNLSDIRCAK